MTVAAIAGCDSDGRTRPPQTQLRFLNLAPSHADVFFVREERIEPSRDTRIPYGGAQAFTFDSDTYDFSIRVLRPWETALTSIAEIRESIDDQSKYYIVATEANGTEELLFFAQPADDGAATLQIVHAAENQPAVDAYFFAPGTDPAAATPIGSVAFRQGAYSDALTTGDHELVLTAAGDPATVLFRSNTVTVPESATLLIAIAAEGGVGTAPFGVYAADTGSQRMIDETQLAAMRVINGASDRLDRDVYLDGDFTTPFVGAAAFGAVGTYQPLDPGTPELTVTPAGNPSVAERTTEPVIAPGRRYTTVIGGNPTDGLFATAILEDHRSIDGIARLQIINAEHEFDNLSYYVLVPGTSIDDFLFPSVNVPADGGNAVLTLEPGDYELTIEDPATSTVVAGPIDLTLADGDLQGILATDAVGGSTVDVLVYDPRTP